MIPSEKTLSVRLQVLQYKWVGGWESLSAMHLEALLSNAKMQNLKVAECFISKVQRIQIRNVYIPAYGATLGQLGHEKTSGKL
eukprot:g40102.t1